MEEEEQRIASLIQKCPSMRVLRQIHACVLTRFLPIRTLSYALSKIAAFCAFSPLGDIDYARRVFTRIPDQNIFSWNSMIKGSSLIENPSREPVYWFKKLVKKGYPCPNSFTLAFVLKACSIVTAFEEGRQVHTRVLRSGYGSSPFVQTALVNFYAKCNQIGFAKIAFDEIPERNLVAWSTMISGYVKVGMYNAALGLFREMQEAGVEPDEVTLLSVISACAISGALDIGRWVHSYIEKQMIDTDLELSTALVNMYAKCGCIEKAKEIFHEMPVRDTKVWSTMIMGLAVHGLSKDALETFARMEDAKVKPNHVTFLGVLSACVHGGLVSEGWRYWSSMLESGIEPSMEHYSCMVDLLCRAGLVDEAFNLVEDMAVPLDPAIWRTLLVGCMKNKMLNKGEIVAKKLLELEPLNAENYILLSNFYASVSQWDKKSQARQKMKEKGIKAIPGCSSIEVDGFVYEFAKDDFSHPETEELNKILRNISERVREFGHKPWISDVLHDLDDEEKETEQSYLWAVG